MWAVEAGLGPNDEPVRVQVFKLHILAIPVVERRLFAVEVWSVMTMDEIVALLDIFRVDRGEGAIDVNGDGRVPGRLRETARGLWDQGDGKFDGAAGWMN